MKVFPGSSWLINVISFNYKAYNNSLSVLYSPPDVLQAKNQMLYNLMDMFDVYEWM